MDRIPSQAAGFGDLGGELVDLGHDPALLGEGGLCLYLVSVVGSGANLCLDGLELVLAEVRALQDEVRGLRDKVDKLV